MEDTVERRNELLRLKLVQNSDFKGSLREDNQISLEYTCAMCYICVCKHTELGEVMICS